MHYKWYILTLRVCIYYNRRTVRFLKYNILYCIVMCKRINKTIPFENIGYIEIVKPYYVLLKLM